MPSFATQSVIRERLAQEIGRIEKQAPDRVALAYPSPYFVGMSSLGYQQIYRSLQGRVGLACERVFLPDQAEAPGSIIDEPPVSYESQRALADFPVIAFSVAYEIEIGGVVRMLHAAGLPHLREERGPGESLVLAGGPLTFSNPLPLAPFVDAIVIGEAEGIVEWAMEVIFGAASKAHALKELAGHPHIFVPAHHGGSLPATARSEDSVLPARSAIRTPNTELRNMFLIETERGCSRGCQYCVMRRTTNGGMRIVPKERILELLPEGVERVGLVGAAVSDHPKIVELVGELADRGISVGLSSLRPDRLKEPFIRALKRAGYRTLTTALDGASERLREMIERRGREPHYEQAAALARQVGMARMKLYLMVGLPGETDEDIDECADFVGKLSQSIPIALGIAPFCAKRNTPLDGTPYAGIDVVRSRLQRLRQKLRGRAEVRAASAKWAWVEYVLAQGAEEEGLAAARAALRGGTYSDYNAEFMELGYQSRGPVRSRVTAPRRLAPAPESKGPAQRLFTVVG